MLVADDQALVRTGLRLILDAEPDLTVVGEAADGVEAVAASRELAPDLVLMDIQMPRLDGLAATREILRREPGPRVVVLTTFDRDELVYEALVAGASGFLLKDTPGERLAAGVRAVHRGEELLDPSITRRLVEQFSRSARLPAHPGLELLTEREEEVLLHVARGRSNAEIAAELFVSVQTVKTHVARVLAKLGARDRVQAVVVAYESGLVRPGA
ncbi:MAG: DNA-binding response regulator [Acidobacteria bacterium]|nr:MAG: DNA-binding response regulator [Acidobacteriota bacterium]